MQGDGCAMCSKAMIELDTVADKLDCHRKSYQQVYENMVMKKRNFCELPEDSPAPILIQVFLVVFRTLNCKGPALRDKMIDTIILTLTVFWCKNL